MIGVVVSKGSRILRRMVGPTSDSSKIYGHTLGAGEEMLVFDTTVDVSSPDLELVVSSLIQTATGVAPPSPRCAVVVKANAVSGHVVNAIFADPAIDRVLGATLIPHASAEKGWTWSALSGLQPPANAVG